jgi:hypothetical protein
VNVRDCRAQLPGISMEESSCFEIRDNYSYVIKSPREPATEPGSSQEAPASRRVDSEGEGPA